MLRLAQAASSEYFSEYGTPPNQRRTPGKLDGELNIIPFYGGWEYVFREKDSEKAEKIAWIMEGAVENGDHFGYGQASLASDGGKYPRTTGFDAIFEEPSHDPREVKVLCNTDCSAGSGFSAYFAGVKDMRLRDMWSGNAREILMSTGEFVELTDPLLLELGTGLRRGDILLKTDHMAIAIDDDDHLDTFAVKIEGCAMSRIRTGPGKDYDTIAEVEAGTVLNATGSSTDETGKVWYKVMWEEKIGYTSSKYAVPLSETLCIADTWLRKTAGTSGKEIIVIPKNATVYVTGDTCKAFSGIIRRTWVKCVYGGHIGWASSLNIV